MYRVEDKYQMPEGDFNLLLERMKTILPMDHDRTDGYLISSLYFDDWNDQDYYDTLDGVPERCKHRIRIYDSSFDTIKLEVKHKRYNRIDKDSTLISKAEMEDYIYGVPKLPAKEDKAGNEFFYAIRTRLLKPAVIVTYQRYAFVYETGTVRITFDRDVRASRMTEQFGNPDLVYDHVEELPYVLEVKYNEVIPDFILQALEISSMQQTAYSKYGLCRQLYMREI